MADRKVVINLATGIAGNARLAGATPRWEWIGDQGATY